ncbi:hypothetical protein Tco_0146478 [Tanacetum coccineum]
MLWKLDFLSYIIDTGNLTKASTIIEITAEQHIPKFCPNLNQVAGERVKVEASHRAKWGGGAGEVWDGCYRESQRTKSRRVGKHAWEAWGVRNRRCGSGEPGEEGWREEFGGEFKGIGSGVNESHDRVQRGEVRGWGVVVDRRAGGGGCDQVRGSVRGEFLGVGHLPVDLIVGS